MSRPCWTTWTPGPRLHADGYYAGVYGSAASGIVTLARAVRTRPSFAAPDAVWIARWDLKATTADESVPDGLRHGRRIKQHRGGHVETHGGTAIDIDGDYLDGPVARVADGGGPPSAGSDYQALPGSGRPEGRDGGRPGRSPRNSSS